MRQGFIKANLLLLMFALSFGLLNAQSAEQLMKKIPFDKNVKVGVLPNGLTYYIKKNKSPRQRAELRLAMNCGSMQEEESQRGLAHFLEHMMFNGTKHFEKNSLVKYLQGIGLSFGADLNAYTSFDEIVYKLQVPCDNDHKSEFEKGFLVLEDWAHNVLLTDKDIDEERGVIMEEWRLGNGAGDRIQRKQWPVMFAGSRYKDRSPIGDTAVIKHFNHEEIRRFYKDWFRPDLMAVIAVGDFDVAKVETMIKEHFSDIKGVANPRKKETYDVPMHKERLASVATDKELTSTTMEILYKKPADLSIRGTYLEFKEQMISRLACEMLNGRFSELSKKPTCPFYGAGASSGTFVKTLNTFQIYTQAKEYSMMRAYETMTTELFRAIQNGFTETELQRAKETQYSGYEDTYENRNYSESIGYAEELARNFTQGESVAGIEAEFNIFKNFLKDIKLSDVNKYIKNVTENSSFVTLLSAPDKPGLKVPTEAELLASYDNVSNIKTEAYKDITNDKPLFAKELTPGKVVSETKNDKLETTEWKLSNGVKVILKPTDFKNDQILFSAFSPGGISLADDKDFRSAQFATTFADLSGLSEFSSAILDKKLAGKNQFVSPYIGDLFEGFSGRTTNKEVETSLQLVNLYFTNPRFDQDAYTTLINEYHEQIKNKDMNPQAIYNDSIEANLHQHHFRTLPITEKDLDNVSLEKAEAFYKDRFADASDFTFVFVGSIKLDKIKPLIEKYLGSLPALNRNEKWKDDGERLERGAKSIEVKKGIAKKSSVGICFTGDFSWSDPMERQKLNAMISMLNMRLLEQVREEKGGVYTIYAYQDLTKYPAGEYQINIGFGCDPDRVKELEGSVIDVIEDLQTRDIEDFDLTRIKNQYKNSYEKSVRKNDTWLSVISDNLQNDLDPALYLDRAKMIDSITVKDIKEMAKKYLNTKNYMKAVLVPEKIEEDKNKK